MARSEYSHGAAILQPFVMFLFSPHAVLEVFGSAKLLYAQLWEVSHAPLTHAFLPRETLDFPRSWLLPVLRDYVQGARLGFFTSYFLPLAATLKSRGEEGGTVGVTVGTVLCSHEPQGGP